MADKPRDLVLEFLRRIDRKVDTISDDVRSLTSRISSMEQHFAGLHSSEVDQTVEIARLNVRVERIERRLDLTP